MVDRPTACSRWKMARSPTRSRIVSAVPMKAAAGNSRARICADSSGVPACGPAAWKPVLPGTVSDSAPRMNGNSARKMKYARSATTRRTCRRAIVEIWRRTLVCTGSPKSAGLSALRGGWLLFSLEETAVGFVGIGAHLAEDLRPVGGAHHLADLVGRAASTPSCRQVPPKAAGRRCPGRTACASRRSPRDRRRPVGAASPSLGGPAPDPDLRSAHRGSAATAR